jgi:hypothetical protein
MLQSGTSHLERLQELHRLSMRRPFLSQQSGDLRRKTLRLMQASLLRLMFSPVAFEFSFQIPVVDWLRERACCLAVGLVNLQRQLGFRVSGISFLNMLLPVIIGATRNSCGTPPWSAGRGCGDLSHHALDDRHEGGTDYDPRGQTYSSVAKALHCSVVRGSRPHGYKPSKAYEIRLLITLLGLLIKQLYGLRDWRSQDIHMEACRCF